MLYQDFVSESNRIEGITRDPSKGELSEFDRFMELQEVRVSDLERFVSVYQPNAVLRRKHGLNVCVGSHEPPPGGPHIEELLTNLLLDIDDGLSPWEAHVRYEGIHPFSDGNGRSGRMLWAWQMGPSRLALGFLHRFYYQTLSNSQR